MIVKLLQKIENKLSANMSSKLEEMLMTENKELFNSALKLVWVVFFGVVLIKILFPFAIPYSFFACFIIMLGLFAICFKFNLYLMSAILGGGAIAAVFVFEFISFPLNRDKVLIEDSIVLIVGSLIFYNRKIFLYWNSLSLLFYMLGIIFIRWQDKSPFGIADINFVCIWLVIVGICWLFLRKTLELFDRFKLAKSALMIDPLTSVYNRAYLQEQIERMDKNENSKELTVLAIDIDYFKMINDTYGHPLGDKVLIHFSSIIKRNIHPKDTLIRYGGEEFLVFMWHYGELDIQESSNRLCQEIRENPYVLEEGKRIDITCSIGVATFKPTFETIQECIERSDSALYEAKNNGRNRVVIC